MNLLKQIEQEQITKLTAGKEIPDFAPGDTVIVNVKVVEGERSRVQAYEGVCIARAGGGINQSFTVRKISYGEASARVPLYSPMVDSIKVVRRGRCAAPSSITCAVCAARRRASPEAGSRRRPARPRASFARRAVAARRSMREGRIRPSIPGRLPKRCIPTRPLSSSMTCRSGSSASCGMATTCSRKS